VPLAAGTDQAEYTVGGRDGRGKAGVVEQVICRGVVALDGPSGTGKSTVARRLASTLKSGLPATSGRACTAPVTLAVLRSGSDPGTWPPQPGSS